MPSREELLAAAERPAKDAVHLHSFYQGKIQTAPKCAIRDLSDFAIWYTPGVAAPCRAIAQDPQLVYDYTNKGNLVAIVTNGSRVLGLGNIGPEAGLPVMEGKALLFKYLGGVDAVPLCLKTDQAEDIINTVRLIQPTFGGINLEDISQPECFRVLDALRSDPQVTIPVFHDDQQGTATVVLAGLLNALRIVDRDIRNARFALVGMGAANVATLRLLMASGVAMDQIAATDSRGILHRERDDIRTAQEQYPDKWSVCQQSNPDDRRGGIAEALRDAHVLIAFARPGPDLIKPEWIRTMASDSIVFVCSNPVPEIWPWDAKEAGARIVGTGRSDFPNQLNNSLGFPAIFRGALDVAATTISDEMCLAAARELALVGEEQGLSDDCIIPTMGHPEVYPREAVAVGMKAQEQGLTRTHLSRDQMYTLASRKISEARNMIHTLMAEGAIAPVPKG